MSIADIKNQFKCDWQLLLYNFRTLLRYVKMIAANDITESFRSMVANLPTSVSLCYWLCVVDLADCHNQYSMLYHIVSYCYAFYAVKEIDSRLKYLCACVCVCSDGVCVRLSSRCRNDDESTFWLFTKKWQPRCCSSRSIHQSQYLLHARLQTVSVCVHWYLFWFSMVHTVNCFNSTHASPSTLGRIFWFHGQILPFW